jgi:hypothetical protein
MTKKTTEVSTQVNMIEAERPDWLEKGNEGSESVTVSDMILPRIDVIQALSPQIKKNDPAFIAGAEQGQIFNTVTGTIYGDSVLFIPVLFRKEYVLWKLRKFGGGFIGAFSTEREALDVLGDLQSQDEYEVVETHQHFVTIISDSGTEEAVFSMAKSKLKVSRALNTLIQIAGVDRFAKAYKASAVEASSPKGDFWSLKVAAAGFVSRELYDRCKELCSMIKSGAADVDRTVPEDAAHGHVESAEL